MRYLARILFLSLFHLLLTGCASKVMFSNTEDLTPILTPRLAAAKRDATTCPMPVVATVQLSPTFRYGCFCGKGHPEIPTPGGKNLKDLSANEKEDVLAQYFSFKPIDDIDDLCQKHDVCWLHKGRSDSQCNKAFFEGTEVVKRRHELSQYSVQNGFG